MREISSSAVASMLPHLESDANKYTRGMCELVVGDSRFPGAGVLSAMAATRIGAGYVKAYTSDEAATTLRVLLPSAVARPLEQYALERHEQSDRHPAATVVGCGISATEQGLSLIEGVIESCAAAMVIDGGGLDAIAAESGFAALDRHRAGGHSVVITPHAGEASRLAAAVFRRGGTACETSDPAELSLSLARVYGAVCVLKGPKTFIACAEDESTGDVRVFSEGTPALAKAGTGDILAGCIGGLLSQGLDACQAAVLGVVVHGNAGVLAAREMGELCVTTEDVLRFLPEAVKAIAS